MVREQLTYSVTDVKQMLGLSQSATYNLVNAALDSGHPFIANKINKSIRISKKSFDEYLVNTGLI